MKNLFHLLATDLTVTLAVLLVLAGSFLLPYSRAATSSVTQLSVEVTCTEPEQVCAEEPPAPPDPPSGGGGGGGSYIPPVTPVPPVVPPVVVPVPVEPDPQVTDFRLYDVAPKIFFADRPIRLILYGTNFPDYFEIHAKNSKTEYSIRVTNTGTFTVFGSTVRFIQPLPANVLPTGNVVLWITRDGQKISGETKIFVHSTSVPLGISARAVAPQNIEMEPGGRTKVSVTFTNTGEPITSYINPLLVGTTRPYDRTSSLYSPEWVYGNRPSLINFGEIGKGKSFTTDIWLTAPSVTRATTYTENFALVAEGLTWVPGSDFSIRVRVAPAVAVSTPASPAPTRTFIGNVIDFFTPAPAAAQTEPNSPYVTPRPNPFATFFGNLWNFIVNLFT